MRKGIKGCLIASLVVLGLIGLTVALLDNYLKGGQQSEIQVHQTKPGPDGKWTAVVQLEASSNRGFVTIADDVVRLKGPAQKDPLGDLVTVVPASSAPSPSVDWSDGKLIVTLPADEKCQYFANPVNGIPIDLQHK
jgi:hypothetical protein